MVWCYSMRSMGFGSHIGHSNLWDLHWRDRPPKYLALETNGSYVQGTQGLWGSQILLLRDSRVISLILTPSIKATVRELPGLHVKVYLLILKHLLGGQGWVRTFLGMEAPGECHFCILPIPCLCRQRHGHSLTRAAGLLCSWHSSLLKPWAFPILSVLLHRDSYRPQHSFPALLRPQVCPDPSAHPMPPQSVSCPQHSCSLAKASRSAQPTGDDPQSPGPGGHRHLLSWPMGL